MSIKERVWGAIAWFLSFPAISSLIVRLAQRTPYWHLGGYMHRWWIVPYSWNLPFAIRVHHILREDVDHHLHDHPWDFRTIVLQGWYVEEQPNGEKLLRNHGETVAKHAESLHRIDNVCQGGVYTLFITYKKVQDWGFMVPNKDGTARKVHHETYFKCFQSGKDRVRP